MHQCPPDWHSRSYLPHFDNGIVAQFVTYRLADSLPAEVLHQLTELTATDAQRREQIEWCLYAGHGRCSLRDSRNASAVVNAWKHFDGVQYRLHAWVVMPNHVHVLFEPLVGTLVDDVIGAWKSVTARAILRNGGAPSEAAEGGRAPGKRRVWQPDYFDRYIRNPSHFAAAIDYIHNNPVKAGFVPRPAEWKWGSAHADARA